MFLTAEPHPNIVLAAAYELIVLPPKAICIKHPEGVMNSGSHIVSWYGLSLMLCKYLKRSWTKVAILFHFL
jgi:hypothetical protein